MSGLEVVGLVAGIVSAFTGAGGLFRNWRRDRKERRLQEKNQRLEQTLVKGSSDVQTTYDHDFRRLGPMFARGDGMTPPISSSSLLADATLFFADIGRSTLAEQLIKLQGTVISILTGETPISALVYPQHDLLSDTSIAVRLRSLGALAEQYQRMSQAAPISAPPTVKLTKDCDGAMRFQSDENLERRNSETGILENFHTWRCSKCKWTTYSKFFTESSAVFSVHVYCYQIFMEYFHAKGELQRFRCALCDVGPVRSSADMREHLKDAHGCNLDEEARNNKDSCSYHRMAAHLLTEETKRTAN